MSSKRIQGHKTKLKCNIYPTFKPHISNEHRKGDIRHCYADTQKAHKLLNYKPSISLGDGLTELTGWAKDQGWGATDLFEKALKELREKKTRNLKKHNLAPFPYWKLELYPT